MGGTKNLSSQGYRVLLRQVLRSFEFRVASMPALSNKETLYMSCCMTIPYIACQNHLFNMYSSNLQQFPADGLENDSHHGWSRLIWMMALKTNNNWPYEKPWAWSLSALGMLFIGSFQQANMERMVEEASTRSGSSLGRLIPWLIATELDDMGWHGLDQHGKFLRQTWWPHGSTSSRLSLVSRCFAVPKWPWITWTYYARYQ